MGQLAISKCFDLLAKFCKVDHHSSSASLIDNGRERGVVHSSLFLGEQVCIKSAFFYTSHIKMCSTSTGF